MGIRSGRGRLSFRLFFFGFSTFGEAGDSISVRAGADRVLIRDGRWGREDTQSWTGSEARSFRLFFSFLGMLTAGGSTSTLSMRTGADVLIRRQWAGFRELLDRKRTNNGRHVANRKWVISGKSPSTKKMSSKLR